MLGWLLAHQQATGAAFYPFIGQGHLCFQFPTYLLEGSGTFLERVGAISKWIFIYPLLQLSLAAIGLFLFSKTPLKRKAPFIVVLTLPFLAGFMVLAKTGVYDFGHFDNLLRYIAPLCQAVLIFVFLDRLNLSYFSWQGVMPWSRVVMGILILSYPIMTNLIQRYRVTERYFYMKKERVTNDALHSPTIALDDIRSAQNATPPGATIYVKASRPNLFNFQRNRIFVADYPNQMSPTQCLDKLPISGSEFVNHLRQNGIDYVIYNFKNEGGYPRATFQYMLSHQWAYYRRTALMTFYGPTN